MDEGRPGADREHRRVLSGHRNLTLASGLSPSRLLSSELRELWQANYLADAYRRVVVDPKVLLLRACQAAGTTIEEVRSHSKNQRPATARQLVCALLRTTGMSFPKIGDLVGYSEHSTVIHGVRKIMGRPALFNSAMRRFKNGG